MAVAKIPLESLGLVSVEWAAAHHGCDVRAVQRWVTTGRLPAVVAGSGNRVSYLLRRVDVEGMSPPARGRPKKPPEAQP